MPPPPAPSGPSSFSIPDYIRQQAQQQGVPPELALAVAEQESGFRPDAVNPTAVNGEHAQGVFQFLPSTAKTLGIDHTDPVQNIQGGVKYLHDLLEQHKGDADGGVANALKAFGGVKTDQTYVPSVIARIPKFQQTTPPPAATPPPPPGTQPTSTMGRIVRASGFDPRTREGRQNIAGAVGGIAAPIGIGAVTDAGGLLAGRAESVAGAGAAGALEERAEQFLHGEPYDPEKVTAAGTTQAAYDTAGQAAGAIIGWPLRRMMGTAVGRYATESLEKALESAQATIDAAKARFGMTAPAVTAQQSGRLAETAIKGPAKTALNQLGEAVEDAAASGPPIKAQPLREKLAALSESITPMASHSSQQLMAGGSAIPADAIARSPDLQALAAQLPADHPLPTVLSAAQEAIGDQPTIPFSDAHKLKVALDAAVNWDRTAKKPAEQITKGFRTELRDQMAGHAPYDDATAAYADAVQLHRRGIAPTFLKSATENPERIVALVKGNEPTKAQMLKDLLTGPAEQGGAGAAGEPAWNAVRASWTYKNLIQGGVEKLNDRIGKLDPDFVKTMYGDPQGQTILGNLQQIGKAWSDALDRETSAKADIKAFSKTSLARPERNLGDTVHDLAGVAMFPHSIGTPYRIARLVKGPKMNDLVEWASRSPMGTQLMVRALSSPVPASAVSDLTRLALGASQGASEEPPMMPSHAPSAPPPAPVNAAATPPPAPR